jgi:hypothetical protein
MREVKSEALFCPFYCSCMQVEVHTDFVSCTLMILHMGTATLVVMQLLDGAISVSTLTGNCSLIKHKFAEVLLIHVHQFYHVAFIASLSTTAVTGCLVRCRIPMQ